MVRLKYRKVKIRKEFNPLRSVCLPRDFGVINWPLGVRMASAGLLLSDTNRCDRVRLSHWLILTFYRKAFQSEVEKLFDNIRIYLVNNQLNLKITELTYPSLSCAIFVLLKNYS